jgi:hypothetical protein
MDRQVPPIPCAQDSKDLSLDAERADDLLPSPPSPKRSYKSSPALPTNSSQGPTNRQDDAKENFPCASSDKISPSQTGTYDEAKVDSKNEDSPSTLAPMVKRQRRNAIRPNSHEAKMIVEVAQEYRVQQVLGSIAQMDILEAACKDDR